GAIDVTPLLSKEFAIEDAEQAYAMVTGETAEPFIGLLLRYDGDARAPLAPREPPRAPPRAAGVRVGVVGAGVFAKSVLLPALKSASAVRLTAITTAGGATAEEVRRNFGFDRVGSSGEDVIAAADVDAVMIATRHDSHARLVAAALAAGKPCFVEKPL